MKVCDERQFTMSFKQFKRKLKDRTIPVKKKGMRKVGSSCHHSKKTAPPPSMSVRRKNKQLTFLLHGVFLSEIGRTSRRGFYIRQKIKFKKERGKN